VAGIAGRRALLLWAGVAVAAMLALAWAVGKHSTPLDDWFLRLGHSPARWLLFFTDPWVLTVALMFGIAVALHVRRNRLAWAMVISPLAGIVAAQALKRVIGRMKGDGLAYPSGHTTTVVIVMGMLVLLAGVAWWSVLVAAVVSILGMIGQGVTHHYFTDTVGGLLLGTAVVCVAATAIELDTRQPASDADHSSR
jgi:membrane-associated phospholipid phosphatase